jgi:hypothetical protein
MNTTTRRDFVKTLSAAASGLAAWPLARSASPLLGAEERTATTPTADGPRPPLTFNQCCHPVEFMENRDLGRMLVDNGIEKVWLAGWFYGQWSYDKDKLLEARSFAEKAGLKTALVNVPIGHPGNSLGEVEKLVPLTIPPHWRYRLNVDGKEVRHCGCLNDASWNDNLASLREVHQMGFREVFMDDDLRLSVGPGVIGGCFCPDCITRFKAATCSSDADVDEIRRQVRTRVRGDLLVRWLKFHGGRLTAFVNACNAIAPDLAVGIMVMFMGHEQAGIELEALGNRLFRVGEGQFDDRSFGSLAGKMTSFSSSMFHMGYANPRLAYSESTAFPPTGLSAENLGRKIAVPLMAGVPNVMFMSGIRMYPRAYWPTLKRHIASARQIAARLPAERPTGVLKQWFGPGVRSVAGGWPLVECLALGLPVTAVRNVTPGGAYLIQAEDIPFLPEAVLSDADTTIVTTGTARPAEARCRWIDAGRDSSSRWEARDAILHDQKDAPHVTGTVPVAVRWYRGAGTLLLWNVNETEQTFNLVFGGRSKGVKVGPGDLSLVGV